MILCLMLYLNDYIRHVLRMKNDTLMLIILYIINYRIHKARTGATLISMHTVVAVRCNASIKTDFKGTSPVACFVGGMFYVPKSNHATR